MSSNDEFLPLGSEPKKKQGFAALSPEKHKELSSKGGQAKVPKGTATLSPEQRTLRAREAANALWSKRKNI